METDVCGVYASEIRYVKRARAYLGRPFTGADMTDVDLDRIAQAVLDAEPQIEEIVLINLDRIERGYMTVGHVAAIINWLCEQPTETPTFRRRTNRCAACHRELTDAESIERGYGPECWKGVAA